MCVIIVKEEGQALFEESMLHQAWDCNPHGAGLLFHPANDTRGYLKKGMMTWDDFWRVLRALPVKKEDFLAMEFRYATTGCISAEQCPPSPIDNKNGKLKKLDLLLKRDRVLFHNGTVGEGSSKFSDSQLFIKKNYKSLCGDFSQCSSLFPPTGGRFLLYDVPSRKCCYAGKWMRIAGYRMSKEIRAPYPSELPAKPIKTNVRKNSAGRP